MHKTIPCHKKTSSHEKYALQQWGPTRQQMTLAQRQVCRPNHAAQFMNISQVN